MKMGIKISDIGLGVLIIEPDYFEDYRGYYSESYSKRTFIENDIFLEFKQDNHSYSAKKGTIRGIHFQNNPMAQAKLVRCINGKVIDYSVDLRKGSPTYKEWVCLELSKENRKQVLIPAGFGHAFETLEDDTEILYKVDEYYDKDLDRSVRWDDSEIDISWHTKNPILSKKDLSSPTLKESDINFIYKEVDNDD
jgi:dTDP-4-dehydrorhamnose 3,5-epimerase